jgi:phenylacetic acid degradation operon negative regulatory protein
LGFGSLAPGTWISPRGRRPELQSIFDELGVESFVNLFCGIYFGPSPARDLVHQCWDLTGLEAQYRDFIAHHEPAYLQCLEQEQQGFAQIPEECFLRRFWLMHEFQSFPLKDPNLPTALLPPDWIGFIARKLFDDYRRLLGTYANQFINDFVLDNGALV